MGKRASTVTNTAALSSEFGYNYAVRLFGQAVVDQVPLLTRGPNKGKPRGKVAWIKSITDGYAPEAGGYTPANRTIRAALTEGNECRAESAMQLRLANGRVEAVCLSLCFLYEDGIARLTTSI